MNAEITARQNHRCGMSCSASVYKTFVPMNIYRTDAPAPRSEGGKCGAVLAAEKVLREMGCNQLEAFDKAFIETYGSLKCSQLLGSRKGNCNDYVGIAAGIVEQLLNAR